FTVTKADTITRFYLNIEAAPGITTGVDVNNNQSSVDIFSNKHIVYVKTNLDTKHASMVLLNSAGQIVWQNSNCTFQGSEYLADLEDIKTGLYIVQIKIEGKLFTKKIILD
ncbi:MAG: T9SS type A sorting domain-containing protein, partial [Cytophagales bacterium]|nr:T9SS type A sorting domain-containing protein [Cytophaga sp.]